MTLFRREAAEAKRESAEHSEVVLGLKRDLAGAWARLSDVTGELSDEQKQKVEEYKERIDIQDRELHEQREQLKKLSAVVDFQKGEIERYGVLVHINVIKRRKMAENGKESKHKVGWEKSE